MTFLWRGKVRGDTPIMRARGPGRAGWIVVDFKPGETHRGGRVAYGPWRSSKRRAVAVEAWRRDPMVASVTVYDARPIDVVAEIAVRG